MACKQLRHYLACPLQSWCALEHYHNSQRVAYPAGQLDYMLLHTIRPSSGTATYAKGETAALKAHNGSATAMQHQSMQMNGIAIPAI